MANEAVVRIRPETEDDYEAIARVNRIAFGGEEEPELVAGLRLTEGFDPRLSFVAENDEGVIGHILFSPVIIESGEQAHNALTLAPMSVLPDLQRRGIGSRLVEHGLSECRRLDHRIIILIGHPSYYPRFGFQQARPRGLDAPWNVPDEAFMVLELIEGALDGISGMVRWPKAFEDDV